VVQDTPVPWAAGRLPLMAMVCHRVVQRQCRVS